jgi:hypothetical protein
VAGLTVRTTAPGWRWLTLLVVLVSAILPPGSGRTVAEGPAGNGQFGIDFVNAPGGGFSNQSTRYAETSEAGAGWDRWVIYWDSVETQCTSPTATYDWSQVDPVVNADLAQGLTIDAILLGTPSCDATPATTTTRSSVAAPHGGLSGIAGDATAPPVNLYQPTFADGTDTWWPGKAINPNNPWARFVNAAVTRYHGQIENWEIWNEPDFSQFWTGSLTDYVRLLKVAYLAAHAADSSAQILVGGMMYWQWANQYNQEQAWLSQFLAQDTQDPTAAANGYYFDVIPWHWYSRSSDSYTHTLTAEALLASYGITGKEVWINETNAPACNETDVTDYVNCNDYPGGSGQTWADGYATDYEQASYIIQSIAYGLAAGANRVFEFQLQDDGNGEAFGMYRNDGSVRPLYQAYQLAVQYLKGYATASASSANGTEQITFGVPGPNPHRTTVLFNNTGQTATATLVAAGGPASAVSLIQQDGTQQTLAPASSYAVSLPPATDNRNFDVPWNSSDYIIGGPTMFLVESLPPDTTPPHSAVTAALPQGNPVTFQVSWSGSDPGGWGVLDYSIQVRDVTSGTVWTNWLTNTTTTTGVYTPVAGHTYQFRSLARDWAGNVETKCVNVADVTTTASLPAAATHRLTGTPPGSTILYFPFISNSSGC